LFLGLCLALLVTQIHGSAGLDETLYGEEGIERINGCIFDFREINTPFQWSEL